MDFQTHRLTQTQQRMLETSDRVGNLCAVFRLRGAVDERRLDAAIKTIVGRAAPFAYKLLRLEESLTIFTSHDPPADLTVIDADAGPGEDYAFALIRSLSSRSFRLDGGAPYLFCLLKGRTASHLVFVCHPALLDRFSLKPLFAAISEVYNGHEVPEVLGLAQDDLLAAERQVLDSVKHRESIRFWLKLVRETSFEYRPARLEGDLSEGYFSVALPEAETVRFKAVASRLELPPAELLLFSFHLFLSRMTRNDTVLTSFSHRIGSGLSAGIGFNENKPVFKSVVDFDAPVSRFFKHAAGLYARAKFHSDIPAREMARELARLEPDFKRVSNVFFGEDPLPYAELKLDGIEGTLLPHFSHRLEIEDVSIHFDVRERVTFHALTRAPQEAAGLRIALEHFIALLSRLDEELERPAGDARLSTPELRKRALELADGGPLKSPIKDVFVDFEELATRDPSAPALRCGVRAVSYGELLATSLRLAGGLTPHLPSGREALVGLCLPRERMVEAMLGVLAAGAAYVPLDPAMPAERLGFIVKDSGLAAVVVDSSTRAAVAELVDSPLLQIDELERAKPLPRGVPTASERAAYVIYTSGTTGKPKGCVIERGNLAFLVASLDGIWDRAKGTRWLEFAAFTFDASVLSVFNALQGGGELVVAPAEVRTDPEAVFRLLSDARVTHADMPPAMLPLLPRRPLPELRVIFSGGEAIDEESVRFWSKAVELANCYGPTEATVMCTVNKMGGYKAATHLGRPLPGYQTYVVDERGELAGLGGVGEIWVGGPGVGRGYLNRPELSAQKFMVNPFGPGRVYRTGDLARFLPNGELEFLGRCDFQVKIRGFRIELGEIEAIIAEQPEVKGSHVGVLARDGTKSLVAWYVSKNLSREALRARLSARLPHYMVPSFLVRLDAFPVTLNGKIDRARLPAPSGVAEAKASAVMNELDRRIRAIWAEVLKTPEASIGLESQFFFLGGHSLLAALACNRINAAFGGNVRPKALFEHPVFSEFCEHVRGLPQEAPAFAPLTHTEALEAPAENRLLGLIYSRAMSHPDDNTYNIISKLKFSGEIHPLRLRQALRGLIEANPIFRARFSERAGRIWVDTAPGSEITIPLIDAESADIDSRLEECRREVFVLARAPLWRAELACSQDGTTTLIFAVHHSIFDGWSLNLFVEELAARYDALTRGTTYARAATRLTWVDYCLWSRDLPESAAYKSSIAYWRKKLAGASALTELPADSHQKRADSNASIDLHFPPATVAALQRFADSQGITLPPVLFSLYCVWLWRLSDQSELIIGYPYAGRDVPGSEEIYASLVTMGFLRQTVDPEKDFVDLAREVHRQMIEDKDHLVAAPYDAEIANMDSLNAIFSLQSGISLDGKVGGATFKAEELPSLTSKSDLTAIFYQTSDGALEGRVEFDGSLFKSERMVRFVESFRSLVESAASNPRVRVGELRHMAQPALERVLQLATGPRLELADVSITERFAAMAHAHGARPAVLFGDKRLSYSELEAASTRLASALLAHVAPGSRVGMSLRKSETLLVAMLGILKAGCAYVPLDPTYPAERLRFFVDNCGLTTVVSDALSREALERAGLTRLAYLEAADLAAGGTAARLARVSPDTLAYVIHTSGSTGVPKGVMVEHRTVTRMILGSAAPMDYDANCMSTLIGPISFDTSVLEIFMPLLHGAALVVMSEEDRKDPVKLHRAIAASKATHVDVSPVMLANMPREPLPAVTHLGFGGDAIDEGTADWWSRQTNLYSLYGPTEITVQCSVGRIIPGHNPRIIGKPLPGYRIYLLNGRKEPTLEGAIGEICVGGDCLSRGYLNRDDLTMERFVIDPFGESPYALMYMTGDLGRFLPDGTIEFLGRNDAQVKVRGFRIELGEIENRLSTFAGIEHVACAAKGEGDLKALVAYYVAAADLDEAATREHLAKFLPDYMIPSFYVRMKELPASPNGKIDRKRLPAIAVKTCKNPPRDGLERKIADVWEDVLRFRGVGRDESFFHVGGNSLLAVRLQAELRRRLGLEISIGELYSAPTIESLAVRKQVSQVELARADAAAGLELAHPAATAATRAKNPKSVLLTGAGGFLGVFLLAELTRRVDQVHCLVRGADDAAALETILKQARVAGLELDRTRFRAVAADLAAPGLGLDAGARGRLASEVDAIIHCGAFVHHLHSYSTMKAANVGGTAELLRLALDHKLKTFCFVSTITVNPRETVDADPPPVDNGYLLTKWAAEKLVASCAERHGLPAIVARPGNITGSTSSGFTNFAHNHFWLFNKGCLQLGAYPELGLTFDLTPVDTLARSIAALTLGHGGGLAVANLSNPVTLTQREFYEIAAASGYPAKALPPKEWQKLLAGIGEDNALSTIKEFYTGDLSGPRPPQTDQSTSRPVLEKLGASLSIDGRKLLPTYLAYLKKAGFLAVFLLVLAARGATDAAATMTKAKPVPTRASKSVTGVRDDEDDDDEDDDEDSESSGKTAAAAILKSDDADDDADDDTVDPMNVGANVALATNYMLRGLTQTENQPAVQGGLDWEHPLGIDVSAWGSNVHFADSPTSLELDFTAGYTYHVTGELSARLGGLYYWYTNDSPRNSWDVQATAEWRGFKGEADFSPRWEGTNQHGWYLNGGWSDEVAYGLKPGAFVGYSLYPQGSFFPSYWDFKISLARDFLGLTWEAAGVFTKTQRLTRTETITDPDDEDLTTTRTTQIVYGGARAVFTVSKAF